MDWDALIAAADWADTLSAVAAVAVALAAVVVATRGALMLLAWIAGDDESGREDGIQYTDEELEAIWREGHPEDGDCR